jgi:formylglycine-generating enzyme required for sulfatase activity
MNDLNAQVTTLEASGPAASTETQSDGETLVEQPEGRLQAGSPDASASDTASSADDVRRRLASAGVEAAKADVLSP